MKIKLSKSQWKEIGKKTGWNKKAKQIGSQRRETLDEADMELLYRVSPTEVILVDRSNPNLPHELWVEKDDYAGYVIEIDGKGYEFVSQVSPPYSGPLKDKKFGIL